MRLHPPKRFPPMRYLRLLIRRQLGHRLTEFRQNENRVVPKTVVPSSCSANSARTFSGFNHLLSIRQRETKSAAKFGAALRFRHAAHLLQELGAALNIAPERIASRFHAGPASQRINAQTGIVGQRRLARRASSIHLLLPCVAL